MPVTPTYPGVYIQEVPSDVRTITGVATSITAFIGRARRGPTDEPTRVQNIVEFTRKFGGLWSESMLSYAVRHFFLNGGSDALVVRVEDGAVAAQITLTGGSGNLILEAANPGEWSNRLKAIVDNNTRDSTDTKLFNLTIRETENDEFGIEQILAEESFRNVSVDSASPRNVQKVLADGSELAKVTGSLPGAAPTPGTYTNNGAGDDGNAIDQDQISNSLLLSASRKGLWALDKADLFNILCIPPFERDVEVHLDTWSEALAYCTQRRAFLIVDPPNSWVTPAQVTDTAVSALGLRPGQNAAVYFPRVKAADPLQENRVEEFAPCGVVAGIFARTDAQRGVWKAPAGQEAATLGVRSLSYVMTDGENGTINPLGVNCLRNFRGVGNLVWGARTLEGADRLASEWKYVPVRRTALYIEESLYRGTQWAVFEPNDEPLWAQIRLNVGAFMHNLFRQGAFQGSSPRDAYFVKCDKETTTQNDIDLGIVNILVGFAPLKPAEFVIIKISQIAGQIQA